ncbi:MAG TPA: AAA family ATPase [Burkholderiales bacterium]|nr:AAA family ATPase [Burkholderiales bacterium]
MLLAGECAYKIKKPVALGFLDFSTLPLRRFYCDEELRLNRRTAPRLYLEVVSIAGSEAAPRLGGPGEAIEYAVRMRRFPQEALLSRMAQDGTLTTGHIDALAQATAALHAGAARADGAQAFGTAAEVLAPALQNFEQIEALVGPGEEMTELERLRAWTRDEHARLRGTFTARKAEGFVRECHGDLHLGNVALIDGQPTPFDGIEFNEAFRWIDVMSDVAFMVMDLTDRRLPRLAYRFLNAYLENVGDYAGLSVLRYYLVYRALVRAKVACIRVHQQGVSADELRRGEREHLEYLRLARSLATGSRRALVLMHGLSGSGKTTVAQHLVEALGGVRVRSDVERKRLVGLEAQARSGSALGAGLYAGDLTARTYARLAELARAIVDAGYPAVVDATFLSRAQREAFAALARELGVPCAIADCEAPEALLRERVALRERAARDASEAGLAVLEHQLASREPLTDDELHARVVFDTRSGPDAAARELGTRLGLSVAGRR